MLRRKIRSALLVDYDNVGPFFKQEKFAGRIANWLSWLEDGVFDENRRRLFAVKNVYWHKRYDAEQPAFEHFQFKTHTCVYAAGGKAGQSAVDIHLALDAIEAAHMRPRIQEVIILASDSDYLPVIERLNAKGLRTGIVYSERDASRIYRGKASFLISEDDLRTAVSYVRKRRRSLLGAAPEPAAPTATAARAPAAKSKFDLEKAADIVVDIAMKGAEMRVGLREIGTALQSAPEFRGDNSWLRLGSFEAFANEMARRRPETLRTVGTARACQLEYIGARREEAPSAPAPLS